MATSRGHLVSGAILSKVKDAAVAVAAAQRLDASAASSSCLNCGNGDLVHITYDAEAEAFCLAFAGSTAAPKSAKADTPCSSGHWVAVEALLDAGLVEQFGSIAECTDEQMSLIQAMERKSGDSTPRRVSCVGHGRAAGLAIIAAFWLAAKLPSADVRCITFGAAAVGDAAFAHAFERIVALTYRVVNGRDPLPCDSGDARLVHVGSPLWLNAGECKLQDSPESQGSLREADGKWAAYVTALARAGVNLPSPGSLREPSEPSETASAPASGAQRGPAEGASRRSREMRPSTELSSLRRSALLFTRGLSSISVDEHELDAIEPAIAQLVLGSKSAQAVSIAGHAHLDEEAFSAATGLFDSCMLQSTEYDARVHVAVLEGGTAVFAFRGHDTAEDVRAATNARQEFVPFLQDVFPEARAHPSFMRQFACFIDVTSPSCHIAAAVARLAPNTHVTRVICCGHGVGGALATLAACWAALAYPAADTRCVTLGSPRVGNEQFVQAAAYLVGTMHRLVNGRDPVPMSPPPRVGYKHVHGRVLLQNSQASFGRRTWFRSLSQRFGKDSDHAFGAYTAAISAVTGESLPEPSAGANGSRSGSHHSEAGAMPAATEHQCRSGGDTAREANASARDASLDSNGKAVCSECSRRSTVETVDTGTDPVWDTVGNMWLPSNSLFSEPSVDLQRIGSMKDPRSFMGGFLSESGSLHPIAMGSGALRALSAAEHSSQGVQAGQSRRHMEDLNADVLPTAPQHFG